MDKGFPRQITDDFPGIEPQVDAVLHEFGKKHFMLSIARLFGVFYGITFKYMLSSLKYS
jgi:hypothetical protein